METPFKPQTFAVDDVLTREVVDQMYSNQRWLFENTPRARWYFADDEKIQETDFVLTCGKVTIPQSKKENTVKQVVKFGEGFDSTCHPNVTIGINSDAENEIFVAISGPDDKLLPDSSGFTMEVHVREGDNKEWAIAKAFNVFWQAAGWKPRVAA